MNKCHKSTNISYTNILDVRTKALYKNNMWSKKMAFEILRIFTRQLQGQD